jgi:V/A-type H+-transporting ATPase subunit C
MYSRLLSRSDYDALLRRTSVPQIAEYLKKETPYSRVLSRLNENSAHRSQLEGVLKRSLFFDYEKLIGFSSGGYKAAIKAMFEEHEVADLKLVISSICSDHEQMLAADDLSYARRYSSFGVNALLEPTTMAGLVSNLKGTRYHDVLSPFAENNPPDFLKIDRSLDLLSYRSKLSAFNKELKGAAREACMDLFGQQTDVANIQFIYRMKKLYRYSDGDIIVSLMPHSHRIEKGDLQKMAGCDGVGELIGLIARTWYKHLFPGGDESAWETIQAEHFYAINRANLRKHGGDANVALSYLHLKAVDIKNIIVIVEGIRYALPAQQIASFLVGRRAA